jgi:hypothetical protein
MALIRNVLRATICGVVGGIVTGIIFGFVYSILDSMLFAWPVYCWIGAFVGGAMGGIVGLAVGITLPVTKPCLQYLCPIIGVVLVTFSSMIVPISVERTLISRIFIGVLTGLTVGSIGGIVAFRCYTKLNSDSPSTP